MPRRMSQRSKLGPAKRKYGLESARAHAETHFLQLHIVNDQVSADETLRECFPNLTKRFSQKILLDLCHSLFPPKRILASASGVTCLECGRNLKLLVPVFKVHRIIDHACSHLDEDALYACRHCSQQFKTDGAVRAHLVTVHRTAATSAHFENKSHHFVNEISDQMKRCFGPSKENKKVDFDGKWARISNKIRSEHKGSEVAIKRQLFCHQLIRRISDQHGNVKCRLCSSLLSVRCRDGCGTSNAMAHVLLHVEKPTMRCRICSKAFSSKSTVGAHLKNVHALPMTNNYDCLADEYHTEILVIIEKCFGTKEDGNGIGDTISPKSENGVRRLTKGSQLAIERKLLCHRLIRKFVDHKKRLQCHLCSEWISAKHKEVRFKTEEVMQHAFGHLAKPLYQCKQCPKISSGSRTMKIHLKTKHALPLSRNYICSQDKYHSELLDTLRECYGDERNHVKLE